MNRDTDDEHLLEMTDVSPITCTSPNTREDVAVESTLPQQQQQQRRRRRLVGRAARRRRRKFKEICAMEHFLMEQQDQKPINNEVDASTSAMGNGIISQRHNHNRTTGRHNNDTVLPMDRDRIWPAVLELRHGCSNSAIRTGDTVTSLWTNDDNIALMGQLGYVPGNAIQVVCRVKDLFMNYNCSIQVIFHPPSDSTATATTGTATTTDMDDNGRNKNDPSPVVLQLYPIVYRNPHAGGKSGGTRFKLRKRQKMNIRNDVPPTTSTTTIPTAAESTPVITSTETQDDPMLIEPFPTIYWLTHPLLRCIVSKLELEGFGIQLERRLRQNENVDAEDAIQMMQRAHDEYGQERYHFLTESDRQLIQLYRWDSAFAASRGVAGISNNIMAVKCLHAHLAHYLSQRPGSVYNIVGRWVWEEIQLRYTTDLEQQKLLHHR